MAYTIAQLQAFSNTKPELRYLTEEIIDYLEANPGGSGSSTYWTEGANGLEITSPAPNSATGVGYDYDTDNDLTNVNSLLARFKNKGVPLLLIGNKGGILIGKRVLDWDGGNFPGITILRDESVGETAGVAIDIAATDNWGSQTIFTQISDNVRTAGAFRTLQYTKAAYEENFDVFAGADNGDKITLKLNHKNRITGADKYIQIAVDTNGVSIVYQKELTQPFTMDANGNIYVLGNLQGDGFVYGQLYIQTDGHILGTTKIRGSGAFVGTGQSVFIAVAGGLATDFYTVSATGTSISANDVLCVEAVADGFNVHRPAAGTSGLTFNYIRIK